MRNNHFTKIKIEGRQFWVSKDGSWIRPVISGAADDGDDDGNTDGDDEKPTLTQKQLNEILGNRVGKAKEKAISDLVKSLGLESADDLKGVVEAAKKASEQSKTDLEKAQGEATTYKSKAESVTGELESFKLVTAIKFALIDEGLKPKEAELAAKLVDVNENDDEKIKGAIAELKKIMPQIFTGEGKPNVQGGNPGTPPPGTGSGDGSNPHTVARSILHERHPNTKKP